MSKINVEKNKNLKKKLNINGEKLAQYKSPSKTENISSKINIINRNNINIISPGKNLNFLENNSNINYLKDLPEDKDNKLFKGFLQKLNQIGEFGFNEKNTYMFPISNNIEDIPDNNNINTYDNISKNENKQNNKNTKEIKGLNMNMSGSNIIDMKNINLNSNILPNNLSQNKQVNSLFNNDPYDSKYSLKINKIKDDYIDFLQKEFEDNTKKSAILDSNNKELLKKCDDLLHDNRLLSNTLNERTAKLNQIVQENLTIKSQLDKALINNQKNEQKLEFYEEQFNLYKTSNENYQKLIKELKEQIEELNNNITELQKNHEENLNEAEDNYKNNLKLELEKNKQEIEDFYINQYHEKNNNNEQKIKDMFQHIKDLEEKNDELITELTKKDNMLESLSKENDKLSEEKKLFKNQLDQYTHQINELNTIIKHKDSIIKNLKSENLSNEKLLNKSSSCSMIKLDGGEYINENISKLISDNEENKMKIELLNDKIKNIDQIEKKYKEIITSKTLVLSEKLAYQMNSNNISPKHSNTNFNYNNYKEINYNLLNSPNYRSFVSPKKFELQGKGLEDISNPNSPRRNEKAENKVRIEERNRNKFNNMIIISSQNNSRINKSPPKEGIDREIRVTKLKDNKETKEIILNRKPEKSPPPIQGKYYYNNNTNVPSEKMHRKEIKTEKDEIKESIRDLDRKKNLTYKPKNLGIYMPNIDIENNNALPKMSVINDENDEEEIINEEYYLYGIDRDDLLHEFDINSRKWINLRKITEINDISNTFKKDYQYEGTILYNTLTGLYILTGEKTDILYFYNSLTNTISKICKFNNSHDNGSLFLDNISNCLFVFGGKKTRSCEYYSFQDKKIYKLPDLTIDRANASYIVSNNKIYSFFGFSYSKNTYSNSIEYIDYIKKDFWVELKDIKFLKNNISFDVESVSTMYYKNDPNLILIYCGIQGDEEDFVTEYYLVYDSINNTMDKINKWNMQQYKYGNKKWKNYSFKSTDQKGFHFAKNSRFLMLPKNNNYDGYNNKDDINVLIDYKNNVHFILQEKQKIDVYRNEL